ncbi:hypothetical protein [Macrococcus equipercicus]|uniref:Uncharacterized protein n=1 Tax=Macrococcus equipercicus TaxID=69967 RepID=A0A9Q9BX17_9STAP|nr:hypothetical protein [Macrococcus equipercicus]UTH14122.1 hypothetical protein KFV11_01750 [Macrococcus equipercicus]
MDNIVTFFVLDSGSDAERFSERSNTLLIRDFSTEAALGQLPELAAVSSSV